MLSSHLQARLGPPPRRDWERCEPVASRGVRKKTQAKFQEISDAIDAHRHHIPAPLWSFSESVNCLNCSARMVLVPRVVTTLASWLAMWVLDTCHLFINCDHTGLVASAAEKKRGHAPLWYTVNHDRVCESCLNCTATPSARGFGAPRRDNTCLVAGSRANRKKISVW